ncbi:MAG: diguanylate cyclase [Deltaproteobacteria bacterium]|nr:diguanylate cyclase [Deltaproteobacteria bacterium]
MKEDTVSTEMKEEIPGADPGIKSRMFFLKQCGSDQSNSKKRPSIMKFLLNPQKWGLRKRFLFTTGVFLCAGVISLGFFIFLALEKNLENSVREHLTLLEHWVKDELETQKNLLSVSVAFVATLPEITQTIANQDREELKNFILPYMERIRMTSANSSIYFHFHLPSLVSFLRTWDINKWGDDLSSYRNMVVRANRELSSFTGFEIGHGGPVIRSISPIFSNGKHLGSVEAATDISEILQKISLVQNYGMAIVLNRDSSSLWESSQTVMVVDQGAILKSYGDTDNNLTGTILKENAAEGRTGDIFFRCIPFQDFQGRPIGEFILTYNGGNLLQKNNSRISQFIWFFMIGAMVMWTVIYLNVKRIRLFLQKLENIIIASQQNDFSERFDCDHIHCLDILDCNNKDCPVYQNPSLVCYLERGSKAISPRWRNTCVFIDTYNSCDACPVYRMRNSDELTNMSNVVNTMMLTWRLFLSRVGTLLSEVLRNQNQPWNLPSIDQVSDYLEQMAKLTAFSHDLQGVYTHEEIYKQLSHVFDNHFLLNDYALMEVSASDNHMAVAIQKGTFKLNLSQEVMLNSDLCRAKRVAEEICSYPNPVLCPYFNCDQETHIRCCLPMVMGGKVGAVFSFLVLKSEWESRRKQLVILRRYLDVTAPMLSSLRLLQKTKEQSLSDPLTQCYNRRFMEAYFVQYEPLVKRNGGNVGFLMTDMDYFKQVNDVNGHQAGDSILQQTVKVIFSHIRGSDMLIRYGGEEFLIILPDVDSDALLSIGEKIRLAIAEHEFDLPNGGKLHKTISVGIAEYPKHGETINKVIKFSDVALYEAKNQGRNRVVLFNPGMWTEEEY